MNQPPVTPKESSNTLHHTLEIFKEETFINLVVVLPLAKVFSTKSLAEYLSTVTPELQFMKIS